MITNIRLRLSSRVTRVMLAVTGSLLAACSPPQVLTTFDNLHLTAGMVHTAQANNPNEIPLAVNAYALPEQYVFDGQSLDTQSLLRRTGTAGMVIVHNGEIVYESYNYGKNQDSVFLAWSVSKSVTSALVGIAIEEGYIANVSDPVTLYVPALAETAYANSTIEDVLEMASGVRFNEVYLPGTDVFWLQLAIGKDLAQQVQKYVVSDYPTGTFNQYKSSDTQVLGMLLTAATGQTITSYLQAKIWEPAGMTRDARWLADRNGLEATYCGLYASVRDMAKFGLIYLNKGFYNNQQIVPSQWVADSLNTDKLHLQPGNNPNSDDSWGYGYQWWIPDTSGDYAAVGVYNQFIYVNPAANLVIAKSSGAPGYMSNDREDEHIALFRAISQDFID